MFLILALSFQTHLNAVIIIIVSPIKKAPDLQFLIESNVWHFYFKAHQ